MLSRTFAFRPIEWLPRDFFCVSCDLVSGSWSCIAGTAVRSGWGQHVPARNIPAGLGTMIACSWMEGFCTISPSSPMGDDGGGTGDRRRM